MSSNQGWFSSIFNNFNVIYKVGIILCIWGARCIVETFAGDSRSEIFRSALESINGCSVLLGTVSILLAVTWLTLRNYQREEKNAPPIVPSTVPFLGCAVEFNRNPVQFLLTSYKRYGPVFTMQMAGKKFTYLIGNEASAVLFNSKNEDLNAEDVYSKLVTPVFGKGVAYDVPNDIFLEQKKMFKGGLNTNRFRDYVPMIEAEVRDYLKHWGDSGQVSKEIREQLSEHVAELYNQLDRGFCAEAWLLPSWLHWIVPKLRQRDRAHHEMKQLFYKAIEKRRLSGEQGEDMLQTLLDTPYKDGRLMTDDEIAGMLIGLLMAGQHTSSSTSSWLGLFLAKHPDVQSSLYEEQLKVRGSDLPPVEFDHLKSLVMLDCCFKETLRLQPPIYVIIRQSRKPIDVCGYTIPEGHSVCVSPTTNQRLNEVWGKNNLEFNPDRFLDENMSQEKKFCYVPFGAGRHRCIGESFAYVQNKTIWSVLLELYHLELKDEFPQPNFQSMIHTPLSSTVYYTRRKHID